MKRLLNPNSYQRHSTHNSQLYQKLLEDQHFVSEASQAQSPSHPSPIIREQSNTEQVEMVIQFGNNNNASLMVAPNDDPMTLAKRFCFKHNIDPRIISTLASNIKSLQLATFTKQSNYRIERNQTLFDDKQNKNINNSLLSKDSKPNDTLQQTKIRRSRNKTTQSNHNDSEMISNSKSGTTAAASNRYNVFQRLYQDSRKKNTHINEVNTGKKNESRASLNHSNANRSLNESSINSCLYIYEKNTKLKQESRKQNQYLLELKKQKQIQNCKFKPNINPLSNLIANKLRQLDQSSIMNKSTGDRQMLKIKQYLLSREKQEMKQCTFKPKIITKLSTQNSKFSTQRFLKLHEDHYYREAKKKLKSQEKLKEVQKQHHPSINKFSRVIVNKDFFERLEEDKAKRINKRESLEKMKNQQNGDNRPSTSRPPANRNLGQKTIGQYLYEKAKEARRLSTKEPPKILTDPKSSQIYSISKQCAFQYLFELLDSDQDGLISSIKIYIGGLGQQILRLLAPLLSQMEQVDVELNQEQFYQAFGRLYSTFSVEEKSVILKFYKNKGTSSKVSQNPSFQPSLNQRSLMIAREICPDDIDIYENSVFRLKEKENKLNRLRAERMLIQYDECTFHPNVRI